MSKKQAARKLRLSELAVQKALPKAAAYTTWDTKQHGLALRVQPTGGKSWYCVYSHHGRPRWYRIGHASAVGLSDARTLAAEIMLQVARGGDPAAERRAKRSSGTFGELAVKYVEQHAKKHNKSWKQGAQLVERYATERWRDLPAASIQRSDVKNMVAKLKPVLANQVLKSVSAVFSWGMREEIVTTNPCRLIEHNATASRERILSESELPQFWRALDEVVDPITATALKTILLTGQRPGEVCGMRFEHIRDGFWEMPGAASEHWKGTKNAKAHRVALSVPVRALIEALADGDELPKGGYVFQVKPGRAVDRLDKPMLDVLAKLGIERFTPHDLRRTCASTIASLGYGRQAIDRILNHSDRSVGATYDRYSYAKEDQHIMEAVATKLIDLVEGKKADTNVVQISLKKKL